MSAAPQPRRVIAFPSASEPEVTFRTYDRIAPGTYPAYSRSSRIYLDPQFHRWQCLIHFDVLDDALTTTIAQLTWFLNLGCKEKPHAGTRSNYRAAWCLANGGKQPRAGRMSAKIFLHRHATVEVKDPAPRNGIEPAYSKIERVISWNTGASE
jgi:hypothetical protein